MNFLYPIYCKDPAYVQAEFTDEEFFAGMAPGNRELDAYVLTGDYTHAWEVYFCLLSETMEKRTYYRLKDIAEIRSYVESNLSDTEKAEFIKPADDLTNYIFKLEDTEPFVFSKENIPWNSDIGNNVYNQLELTYMRYIHRLGIAYMATGDSKYVVFFSSLINDFITSCPVPRGDDFAKECSTWTRLGVALRLSAILNNFAVMFHDEAFDMEIKKRIIKHLFQTAQYVRKYNADNGNHVVKQMGALLCAAAFFVEFKQAEDWLHFAVSRLEKELDESVYTDGVQAEGSPIYHLFVLVELIDMMALHLNGYDKIPESLNVKTYKMFTALRDMCTPQGCLVNLGDTEINCNVSGSLNIAAKIYEGEFKNIPDVRMTLNSICKFGVKMVADDSDKDVSLPKLSVYSASGFLSYRSGSDKNADFMFMHAGESINGHAHADTLSVILHANGRNILVDTGKAPYVWDKERKYAISTAAHNTVKVDHEDSFVRMLHWLPMRTAPCKIWVCEETDDYVLFFASHYGYHRFLDPVVHTRKLIYVKSGGFWVVLDLLNAEEHHCYEVFFHLPPSEVVFDESNKSIHTKFVDANVLIYPVNRCGNTFEVINTPFYPDKNMRQFKPTYKISSEDTGNKYFATLIVPFGKNVPLVEVTTIPAFRDNDQLAVFDATVLDVTINGQRNIIAINNVSIDPREYINHEGSPDSDAHIKGKKNSVAIRVFDDVFNDEVKIIKKA